MNFPKSTIKKSLHIIPDSLKDGITGDAQVTIGYQIYNLAKLTHTTDGIANLQFGDYNVNKVGLYGKNIEIHADTGRLNEYATDDILIGSAGSKLRIGMYSSTMFNNGVNFMLMTPDVTKFIDKQVILTASNSYENANKVSINNVTTRYGGCLLVGDYNRAHIALDNFQIQAKEDGVNAADKLCLNPMGGSVYINYCQKYFTTITLNRIQCYNIDHTVGTLYLNPAGGNVLLNSNSILTFYDLDSTHTNTDLNLGMMYYVSESSSILEKYKPTFFNYRTGEELTIDETFVMHSISSAYIDAANLYIGCSADVKNDFSVYGSTELNGDMYGLSIKSDDWANTIMNVSGSYKNGSGELSMNGAITINGYVKDGGYYNPALTFNYLFDYIPYTRQLKIKAGIVSTGSTWKGLIIGEDSYNNDDKLHVIFNNDVFARYSAIINKNLQVYGDTKLGNINNLDNFKALTVYGKSRFVGNGIELYYTTPYIDFHFGGNASNSSLSDSSSSDDNTSRIIESTRGVLEATPKFKSTFVAATGSYGNTLPSTNEAIEGQIFFKLL